ncbi:DUF6801 domain-containing protein [Amycolatopsis sp.]|jgi:hypothetical protein|uniref:DUF6801 domain-containing protein n=1 Tax=Amycolatopsis sp. TaxID=37632 RepID=UPI002DFB0D03|nr:DUF6801 domain-containing protein [Amycolatopsis sp.]
MSRKLSKLSAGVMTTGALVGVGLMLASGTASAVDIPYQTGTVSYTCNFPAIGQRPLAVTAAFNAPDSVPAGTPVTPSGITGTASISSAIHALLNAANYDGVRGKADVPVTITNATPASATVTAVDVPTQIASPYVPGPLTFNLAQDAGTGVPALTPTAAGSSTLSLGSTITAPLEFHKKDGTWTPWSFTCNVATSPVQNKAFSPSLAVT